MNTYLDDAADELSGSPQSATLRAATRLDSSGRHHQRRQSASERIDEILEVGQSHSLCSKEMETDSFVERA